MKKLLVILSCVAFLGCKDDKPEESVNEKFLWIVEAICDSCRVDAQYSYNSTQYDTAAIYAQSESTGFTIEFDDAPDSFDLEVEVLTGDSWVSASLVKEFGALDKEIIFTKSGQLGFNDSKDKSFLISYPE